MKLFEQISSKMKTQKVELVDTKKELNDVKTRYKEKMKEMQLENDEKNKQMIQQMQKLTEESSKTINELREQINKLQAEIAEANDSKNAIQLKLKQSETKTQTAIIEKQKMQKQIETQYQANIKTLEAEYKSKLNDAEQNKSQMISSIGTILSPMLFGERVDEYNLDSILHTIRSKYDILTMRDNRIRNILKIGPTQSIEETLTARLKHFQYVN